MDKEEIIVPFNISGTAEGVWLVVRGIPAGGEAIEIMRIRRGFIITDEHRDRIKSLALALVTDYFAKAIGSTLTRIVVVDR